MKYLHLNHGRIRLHLCQALLALLALGQTRADAANRTWTGGGDGVTMSSAANWGGAAPVAGDSLFFAGTTGLSPNNDFAANTAFAGITFNSGAGAFTLSGNAINLLADITNNSGTAQSINLGIGMNGTNRNFVAISDLTNATITGSSATPAIIKWGAGILTLTGSSDNAYGSTVVNQGTVVLAKASSGSVHALGGGCTINTNGILVVSGTGGDQIFDRTRVTINAGIFRVQTNETIKTLSSTNNPASVVENGLAGNASQLTVGGYQNARGNFNGTIRDGASGGTLSLRLNGNSNIQTLNGTNTYSGLTTVNTSGSGFARLLVNGQHIGGGDYNVGGTAAANLAYLGGAGIISATTVNINANGLLSPGGAAADPDSSTFSDTAAVLTFSNAVNLTANNATLDIQLNGATAGASYDQVNIAGTGTFSNNTANLKLSLGYSPAVGDKFTIVKVQGTSPASNIGTFGSLNGVAMDLSQGAVFVEPSSGKSFQISYQAEGAAFDAGAGNGNDIMLQVINPTGARLTWRGDGVNNNWDINTTADWSTNGATLTVFTNGNMVTFDDSGSNNIPVNVTAIVLPASLTFAAAKNYVLSGAGEVAGSVTTVKTNSGAVAVVNNNNNITGVTLIQSGALQIGTNDITGSWSGNITISSNGVLAYMRSDAVTPNLSLSGSGSFVHSGSGTLIITNTLTSFTGNTTNSGGILQIGDGSSALGSIAGTVFVGATNTLRYYFRNNMTVQNSVGGTGAVDYESDGNNTWTFTIPGTIGSPNFTGTNILGVGIKLLTPNDGVAYALGNGSAVNATALGSQLSLGRGSYNQTLLLGGTGVAGTGALNAYRTTLTGPVMLLADTTVTYNGGAIYGVISGGAYNLTVIGNTSQYPNNELTLNPTNGANAYGATTITGGFVKCGNSGALSTNALLVDSTGWLDLNGNAITVASLHNGGSGGGFIDNASTTTNATLVVGTDDSSSAFDGYFGDGSTKALNVTKVGAGTLTLSGTSTNTGTVTVKGGTLALTGSGSFANAATLAVASGATLDVSTRGDGTLTLSANQTLKHAGASAGSINISGNLTLGAGALLLALNRTNSPATNDSLAVSGTFTAGGTLTVTNLGPVLHAGDTFQLFPSAVSGFTTVILQTVDTVNNVQYSWNNTLGTDGAISVASVSSLVNTNAPHLQVSVSGSMVHLAWPTNSGWTLLTNSVSLTATNQWFPYPNSANLTNVDVPVNPSTKNVFFKMAYPYP
ncbi:MAG TPA: autotransporter-associated beta strand repeat-containing protein [Verrucomicrobiae bacterium]